MNRQLLERKFETMGARLRLMALDRARPDQVVRIDVRTDRRGEYFEVAVRPDEPELRVEVIDLRPDQRHLLLMAASPEPRAANRARKQKFLCGHDERAWFVAAVPEASSASNVRTAMEALKPWAARDSQARHRVRFDDRNRRKNAGFIRQGEWFFVSEPRLIVPAQAILRQELIRRSGSGKPHVAEFASRSGGEQVFVDPSGRSVLSAAQYSRLAQRNPAAARRYQLQLRNAHLVVKGRISHADHATIVLREWHSVWMNTENESQAMRSVAFID